MMNVCIGHENFQKWPVAAQALMRNESAFSAFLKDFRVQETQGNTTYLVGRCGQIKDAGYEIFKGLFHTDHSHFE